MSMSSPVQSQYVTQSDLPQPDTHDSKFISLISNHNVVEVPVHGQYLYNFHVSSPTVMAYPHSFQVAQQNMESIALVINGITVASHRVPVFSLKWIYFSDPVYRLDLDFPVIISEALFKSKIEIVINYRNGDKPLSDYGVGWDIGYIHDEMIKNQMRRMYINYENLLCYNDGILMMM